MSIIHKGMDKLRLLTKFLVHYLWNWWMKTEMTGMNTCRSFMFLYNYF
jgi:hypothetical protein